MQRKMLLLFIVFVNLAAAGDTIKCSNNSNCILATECKAYGDMSKQEQAEWQSKNSCTKPKDEAAEEINTLFGFAPFAKGDFVCCPIGSGDTAYDDDQRSEEATTTNNGTSTDSRFGFMRPGNRGNHRQHRPQFSNFPRQHDREDFNRGNNRNFNEGNGRNFNRGNNRDINGGNQRPITNLPIIQNPNDGNNFRNNQGNENGNSARWPQNNNANNGFLNNGGAGGGSQQCESMIQYPPTLESGCCGVDATESDRIAAPPRAQTLSPWAPRTNDNSFGGSDYPGWFPTFFSSKAHSRKTRTLEEDEAAVSIDNRIAGGKATVIGEFPWLVLLTTVFDYGNKEEAFNCGGSIISAYFILTAGHCVSETGAKVKDVEITLAEYDKMSFPKDCVNGEEGRQCITNIKVHSNDVIPHPEYEEKILQNDIALIRVHSKIPYTDFIRPICLPPIDIDSPEFKNLPLSVAGWGRNGVYTSNVKQSTVVNFVPQAECKKAYSFLNRRHLCAAGYSGEDTCKGDSGGPLMVLYEGKYFVSGVVSGKRADSPCGTSVPSLYTNVYRYLDWIKSNFRN